MPYNTPDAPPIRLVVLACNKPAALTSLLANLRAVLMDLVEIISDRLGVDLTWAYVFDKVKLALNPAAREARLAEEAAAARREAELAIGDVEMTERPAAAPTRPPRPGR